MDINDAIPLWFGYDPVTGVLSWKVKRGRCLGIGCPAGCSFTDRHGKSYRVVKVMQKMYYAHNLIYLLVNGCWPKGVVDHIDGNGMNNVWSNLRDVSKQDNAKNVRRHCDNTSGHNGVTWDKKNKKWYAYITVNGVMHNLGRYKNVNDAVVARKKAEVKFDFHPNHGQDRPL